MKKVLPHILAILVMTTVSVVYFYPQLQGKGVLMDDGISGAQAGGELKQYKEKTGKTYLWSNGQFGGMPKMVWVPMKHNHILKIYDVLRLGFDAPIGLYLATMILCYLLYFFISKSSILSVSLSIVTALSTPQVILWDAGHLSKLNTLVFTPLIILGALLIFEKRKHLWGLLTLTFALAASLTAQHPQMTYYILLFFLVFGVVYLIDAIKNKTINQFLTSTGIVVLAGILALSISSTRIMSIYDYGKHSLRGPSILKSTASANAPTSDNGLTWDYAMQWSNDTKDLAASFLVPSLVGGSSSQKVSTKSSLRKKYNIPRAPLYWGNLPGTSGPMYIGVTIFYLFILGLFYSPSKMRSWFGIGILFMILCSMGKNFEIISRILFNYFPLYDKFRAPQSIMNTILFYFPVVGLLATISISGARKRKKKKSNAKKKSTSNKAVANNVIVDLKALQKFYIGSALVLIPLMILALFGTSFLSFQGMSDQVYQQQGVDINDFVNERKDIFQSDAFRSLILITLMAATIWAYLKLYIKKTPYFIILSALILFDVLGVSSRYLFHDDFVTSNRVSQVISTERVVDQQIKSLEPNRSQYRIQDLTINTFNSSEASYLHNTIGGYDPAKLKRYNDIINQHIINGNQNVYNMLNTKYFVVNGDNGPEIRQNPNALGTAWFVKNIEEVTSPDEEIDALNRINPSETAIVLANEFPGLIKPFQYDPMATINLSSYEPDHLVYQFNSTSDQLVVFSEVWYNGNRDWTSYIDGIASPHIRANYLLRAMFIPAGQHEITFKFVPVVYAAGETLSMIAWWLFVILALYIFYTAYKKYRITDS